MSAARVALALLPLALSGCPASNSAQSPSESVQGSVASVVSSAASSGSSSPGAAERAYRADVSEYTATYLHSSGDVRRFTAGLARLAERRGITDWEQNEATYVGVGEGLGRSRVNETDFRVWQDAVAGTDPRRMAAMRKGYDSVR